MSEPDELLGFTLEALDEIDALVGYGHDEFAASLDRQRALAFCWIAVGSALKDYTRIVKLPARQEPGPPGNPHQDHLLATVGIKQACPRAARTVGSVG